MIVARQQLVRKLDNNPVENPVQRYNQRTGST